MGLEFSIYTIMLSIFWVSIFALSASLLRKQMSFLKSFSIYPLLLLLLFGVIRICFSFDFSFTCVIESRKIIPFIYNVLRTPIVAIGSIRITIAALLLLVWGMGAAVITARRIFTYYRFRRLLDFLPATQDTFLL